MGITIGSGPLTRKERLAVALAPQLLTAASYALYLLTGDLVALYCGYINAFALIFDLLVMLI